MWESHQPISSILALRVIVLTVKEARTECDFGIGADADAATRLAHADRKPGLLESKKLTR